MLPMISSVDEVRASKEIIDQCKSELKKEGKQFDKHMSVGIMIEIPSAAVLMNDFAGEVDFVSIGTNDLIQYLLAVDRGNDIVSNIYQEFHPAVVRTLYDIIKSGKKTKTPVSICGEMAADPFAVPLLIGFGLDSLSVFASDIPHIKKIIRNIDLKEVELMANKCLDLKTEKEIRNIIHEFYNKKIKTK